MNGTTQVQDKRREIVFKGQLQQKITKRSGTLLRKKKAIYEDELWVLLCVHEGGNGGIPHLEWYDDLRSAYDHKPLKVQDLLDCQYVNVAIGEERCMVIGFVDKNRPVLELSSPSVEERQQWVTKLTQTLRRLNCPLEGDQNGGEVANCCPRAENEYIALNEAAPSTSPPQPLESPHVLITPMALQSNLSYTHQKLSLTDTIPMHSSPPSTSASPPFSPPRFGHSDGGDLPQSCATSTLNRPPTAMPRQQSKPISINSPLPRHRHGHSQVSPGAYPLDERQEGNEENDDGGEEFLPPPLPPRKNQRGQQIQQPTTPTQPVLSRPILPSSPIPSSPPPISTLLNRQNDSEYHALEAVNQQGQHYDQLNPAEGHHQYQQLSSRLSACDISDPSTDIAALRLSSCSVTTNSTSSNSQRSSDGQHMRGVTTLQPIPAQISPRHSAQYDILSSSAITQPQLITNYADTIFCENLARPRKVALSLSLLAEHVALVDAGGKVWVAGWSPKADTNLRNILHFGDEVEKMAGFTLRNVQQLPEIYASIKPGVQIELVLKANDGAKVYTLTRPTNPKRELGILLHKRKNKIASIERNSPAERANMPARLPPYFFNPDANEMAAMITELDGIPLSPFARNDQLFHRLDQIPVNSATNITLHPGDFCALIARQLKAQIREHRRFVHDQ